MKKFKLTMEELRMHKYELEVEAETEEQALNMGSDEPFWDEIDDTFVETASMKAEEIEE